MPTNYQLVLKSGAEAGKIFPIESTQITIGREQVTDIAISDPEISRRHAHIFLQGVNYVIEDLGSTNGTYVNGQRLVGPYILRPGELITLGENTHLLFEAVVGDPDATVAASKPVAPQPYQSAPGPQAQPYMPAYQAPDVPRPSSGYAGQVPTPPMPDARPGRRKLSPLVIVLVILVVLLLCSCIGFFIFDALNLYCEIPGIMNMLIPGACPP
jgi:pSer/pThr/pTyr-binding forkhead associated (FHA) protein